MDIDQIREQLSRSREQRQQLRSHGERLTARIGEAKRQVEQEPEGPDRDRRLNELSQLEITDKLSSQLLMLEDSVSVLGDAVLVLYQRMEELEARLPSS
jgi:chromosome segregation ATPase